VYMTLPNFTIFLCRSGLKPSSTPRQKWAVTKQTNWIFKMLLVKKEGETGLPDGIIAIQIGVFWNKFSFWKISGIMK
jgi:hypothetical protein